MATRPTVGQRWPKGQEQRRVRTLETAEDAIEVLELALKELVRNPLKAEVYIERTMRYLETIRREMTEAKIGVEAPEE